MHRKTKPTRHDGENAARARKSEAFDQSPTALAVIGVGERDERDDASGGVRVRHQNRAFERLGIPRRRLPFAAVAAVLADGSERRVSLPTHHDGPSDAAEPGAQAGPPRAYVLTLTPLYEDGVRPAFVLVTATLVTDALARATRLHERLRGMVGHDLRNPLSSVMTAASLLLRRGGLPPAQESAARRIESAAQRMARMICHILELSRAALDEETVATRAPSDLAAIVKSAVVEYEGRVDVVFEEGAVAGESGPPGDAWQGEWDCELLRDALASIVRNAVEHARPDTRARLTLRATSAPSGLHEHERERDDRASAFEIVIDNEGAPIALANAARVVDPHDLGDHGKRPGHLGLGLFVAARAIVAHGGNVTLTARGEDGTRVRVVLPRRPYATSG